MTFAGVKIKTINCILRCKFFANELLQMASWRGKIGREKKFKKNFAEGIDKERLRVYIEQA